jgi:hypothetical protein
MPSPASKGLWLNLSGGGFRAALVHLGCMRRLHELGIANRIVGFSATSGGAFIAALWSAHAVTEAASTDQEGRLATTDSEESWRRFERNFVSLVHRGLLGTVSLLVCALTSYAAAYCLFAAGLWLDLPPTIAGAFLALAVALHNVLLVVLLRDGALRPRRVGDVDLLHRVRQLVLALTLPSQTRIYTMDLRAFQGLPLSYLRSLDAGRVFFNAVDLDTAEQVVVSPWMLSSLAAHLLKEQWEGQGAQRGLEFEDGFPLAQAVAAATALPPVFRPITVHLRRPGILGRTTCHLVDAGVTDNAGFRLAHGFVQSNVEGERFEDRVSLVLTIHAGRHAEERSGGWSRLRTFSRLAAVVDTAQRDNLFITNRALERSGVNARAIGLGEKHGVPNLPERLSERVGQVRTHLDGFTYTEIAAIAYVGYASIEYFRKEGGLQAILDSNLRVPSTADEYAEFLKKIEHDAPTLSTMNEFLTTMRLPDLDINEICRRLYRGRKLFSVRRLIERSREREVT